MTLQDRLYPRLYDALTRRFERKVGAALRGRFLGAARGRVLEVGAGTGRNLPHYGDVEELVVTEPQEGMLERARRRADRSATFVRASADALPFPDDSFDTVVATLVLCTVDDQQASLREIRRVLKPAGQFLFAEHVRSGNPKLARWQDRLEGLWSKVAGGCRPNRDTVAAIEASGFAVTSVDRMRLPGAPPLTQPFVAGRATPTDAATP